MTRFIRGAGLLALVGACLVLVPGALADNPITELVPDTAILLNQSGGGGGNGGNTSSTTSRTNIFAPSSYVDYKRLGGEPTVVVDRYPFTPGQFGNTSTTNQFRDIGYYSAPLGVGFPGYSYFCPTTRERRGGCRRTTRSSGGRCFRAPAVATLTRPSVSQRTTSFSSTCLDRARR